MAKKRDGKRPPMTATQARSFERQSAENAAIIRSMLACDCEPYEDVFTYARWQAQGQQVQAGEKGLRLTTYAPAEINEETGEVVRFGFPRKTYVFCRHQVAPVSVSSNQ